MSPLQDSSAASLSRRKILGWGGFGVVAGVTGYLGWPRIGKTAATPPVAGHSSPVARPESVPSEPIPLASSIRREDFLPYLNSEFRLDGATTCTLIDVGAAGSQVSPTARFASFSLLFAAPKDFVSESQIHRLSHARMEPMDLFLSPVGKPGGRVYLEAVFSQRV